MLARIRGCTMFMGVAKEIWNLIYFDRVGFDFAFVD
jgi:hypothetical protein